MDKHTDSFNAADFKPPSFKPITEGLGLNHFADGLPYAPPAHAKKKQAVPFSAPPALEISPAITVSRAVSSPVISSAAIPSFATASEAIVAEPAAAPIYYSGFLRRMIAFGIDAAIAVSIFTGIVWAGFALNDYNISEILSERGGAGFFWPLALLYVVVHMGYFLIQETTWQRTCGKALMGISIRAPSGFAVLGRAICFFVAALPCGFGLFWCFFDAKRRCWHDVISGSEVILSQDTA